MTHSTLRISGALFEVPKEMNIGDSFFVPCMSVQETVAALKRHYAPLEYTLKSRQRVEAGVQGARVWRVAAPLVGRG